MPLSSKGLWDAEITTPPCASRRRVRCAMPGVGSTPTAKTSAPADSAPDDERALEHGAGLARVASDHQAQLGDAVVLEQAWPRAGGRGGRPARW